MEPPNIGHIGSGTFVRYGEVVPISEGALELYFTAIFNIACYNINVISTLTAIIACYTDDNIIVIRVQR